MRLTTILNPRFQMGLHERIERLKQLAVMEIAWALPRHVVYWVVIRGTVAAAGDDRNPADVTAVQILAYYEEDE